MRKRRERIERSFAHGLRTSALRQTHLRGQSNILKRYLVHVAGFNSGLTMRGVLGIGNPKGLQRRAPALRASLCDLAASFGTHLRLVLLEA